MTDKRKKNGRKPGGCQAILESGEPCKKNGEPREMVGCAMPDIEILLRVRVCGKCWEGDDE